MVSKSNVHRQVFWRRVRSGIRTSIAALLTAVLALTPEISRNLTIAFFASVTAIIITDSSLGRTIHNAVMVFWACVASSVASIVCVEIFGRSYTAMLLCLTGTAFLIAYPDVHVLIKKFGLALAGIDFITFSIRPQTTSITFPLRLAATTMLGAACAVASMIVPTPLRATTLVRDRAELAAKSLAALLSTQMDAFCAVEGRSLSKLKVQAGMLRQAVMTNLQSMKDRQEELWWEGAGGAPTRKLQRLLKVYDTLLGHSAALDMALQTGHIHESPKLLLRILRPSLVDIGVWTGLVLGVAVDEFKGRKVKAEKGEQLAGKGIQLLRRFDATLQVARERAYYGVKGGDASAPVTDSSSEEADDLNLNQPRRRKRSSHVETLMKCSVESLITSQFFLFNVKHIAQEALSLLSDSPAPPPQTPRLSFVQSMRPAPPCTNPNCASSGRSTDAKKSRRRSQDATSVQMPEGGVQTNGFGPLGSSNLASKNGDKGKRRFDGVFEFAGRFKPDARKLKAGSKVACAVGVGGLLGIIAGRNYGYWAVVTIAFIIGGYQGTSFRAAWLRLQGTVAGAIYGYLVILVVHGHPVAVGALLVPWVALVTFIRYSKAYGYSGVVAGFTAAIIMLGYKSSNQNVQDYALGRITETCIGIVTFIVVETCVWPNRAALLVREALISALQDARACFAAIVRSYMEEECMQCRQKAVQQVAATEKTLAALMAKQGPLIDEAASEPDFWRAPFPIPVYCKLLDLQKRMARLLYAMDCALRVTGMETAGEQTEKLVKPLQGPLRSLEAEVLLTLDSLIIDLRAPARAVGKVANPTQTKQPSSETELTAAAAAVNGTDGNLDSEPPSSAKIHSEAQAGANQRGPQDRVHPTEDVGGEGRLGPPSVDSVQKEPEGSADKEAALDIESQEASGEGTAEAGEGGTKKKRHKHGNLHLHWGGGDKPVDKEVFQHPVQGTDAAGRLGEAGAVNIRHVFQEYEDVISGLISAKLSNPDIRIVDNTAMLSFNALVFSMRALIAEANDLENNVRELLQVESPVDLVKCINPNHYSDSEPFLTEDEGRRRSD
ncbi:hypothetical protein KFL_007550015 [Klebsormidium nitens]|uniref:Uncharacterized protein n=1 Tax=Klebsormidium nitens TaxID=105231 RepID=A0A1Y1IP48_KLENI|nr:hypothetical protein KFL_007550015 [Klebsormidium nitens]|eukprot:GAQ91269.1 hypothetical protein KFL_007550015 [Klebsormidium nitens]